MFTAHQMITTTSAPDAAKQSESVGIDHRVSLSTTTFVDALWDAFDATGFHHSLLEGSVSAESLEVGVGGLTRHDNSSLEDLEPIPYDASDPIFRNANEDRLGWSNADSVLSLMNEEMNTAMTMTMTTTPDDTITTTTPVEPNRESTLSSFANGPSITNNDNNDEYGGTAMAATTAMVTQTMSVQSTIGSNRPTTAEYRFPSSGMANAELRRRFREPQEMPSSYHPGPNDVICGSKSSVVLNHSGNRRFKQLIRDNLGRYTSSTSKANKGAIMSSIVDSVRDNAENPGHFVRQDKTTGRWVDIGDQHAREKAGYAIRDILTASKRARTRKATRQRALKKAMK